MKKILIATFILLLIKLSAQVPIGYWQDHLSYNNVIKIADAQSKIYCVTDKSMFAFDKTTNEIIKYSKINGLSDIDFSTIAYNKSSKTLVIGYKNGNIDILKNNKIYNLPDLKNKKNINSKAVNNILFINQDAYLSCDFGVLVVNISKIEVKDFYTIGQNGEDIPIYKTILINNKLYSATKEGIYSADTNQNLKDANNWKRDETINNFDKTFKNIEYFNNKIYAVYFNEDAEDTIYFKTNTGWDKLNYFSPNVKNIIATKENLIVCEGGALKMLNKNNEFINFTDEDGNPTSNYFDGSYQWFWRFGPNDALIDENNILWIGDGGFALWKTNAAFSGYPITPSGPPTSNITNLKYHNKIIYGLNSSAWFYDDKLLKYQKNKWESVSVDKYSSELKISEEITYRKQETGYNKGKLRISLKNKEAVNLFNDNGGVLKITKCDSAEYRGRSFRVLEKKIVKTGNSIDSVVFVFDAEVPANIKNKKDNIEIANEVYYLIGPVNIAFNKNDDENMYIGTKSNGIAEIQDNNLKEIYTDINSPLKKWEDDKIEENKSIQTVATTIDNNNILFMTNVQNKNSIVFKNLNTNEWGSIYYPKISKLSRFGKMITTKNNNKWLIIPQLGIFVFNDNGTPENTKDDQTKLFSIVFTDKNETILTNEVRSIAEDLDGDIWIGTDQGIFIFQNNETIFEEEQPTTYRPITTLGEYAQYLLKTENINSIEVDGNNQKWIATTNSGAFLISQDGTKEIFNFNEKNSPILSNEVLELAINQDTGEIFFATAKGLVSYKGTATEGKEKMNKNDVYAYPNPVKNNYSGQIAIKNLVTNGSVKITDITGNIVFQTTAQGGQATWNGENINGKKITNGVYLVFITNTDGTETLATKILFNN